MYSSLEGCVMILFISLADSFSIFLKIFVFIKILEAAVMILLVLLHYLIVSWHTGMRDEEAGRRLQDGKLRELIE